MRPNVDDGRFCDETFERNNNNCLTILCSDLKGWLKKDALLEPAAPVPLCTPTMLCSPAKGIPGAPRSPKKTIFKPQPR